MNIINKLNNKNQIMNNVRSLYIQSMEELNIKNIIQSELFDLNKERNLNANIDFLQKLESFSHLKLNYKNN